MDVTTCDRCKASLTVYHLEAEHTYALALPESYTDQDGTAALNALVAATDHLRMDQKPVLILLLHGTEVTALPEVGE